MSGASGPYLVKRLKAPKDTDLHSASTAELGMAAAKDSALRVRRFETRRLRSDDDGLPDIALAHAIIPGKRECSVSEIQKALLHLCDAVESELRLGTDQTDILILIGKDANSVDALYFRGHPVFRGQPVNRDAILSLADKLDRNDSRTALLNIALGQLPGLAELWVIDEQGDQCQAVSEAADTLLDSLLTANRPVAAWRTSYFMPVRVEEGAILAGWTPKEAPDQDEINYFLESANRLVGKGQEGNLQSWVHKVEPERALIVNNALYGDAGLAAPVTAVRLHQFGGSEFTTLLEWEFAAATSCPKVAVLWRRYLEEQSAPWSFAQLLDFHAQARFIKHHYAHEVIVGRDRKAISLCLGEMTIDKDKNTMHDLLGKIVPLAGITPIADSRDRAFALASVVLDGGQDHTGNLDPLLAQLACADDYSPFGFYDDAFARAEYEASQYRRFWSKGSCFFATGHSFSMLGFRQDQTEIANSRTSFAERKIHAEHMPTIYWRIFMLCLFQQLAVDDIGTQLARHTNWYGLEGVLRNLRRDWITLRVGRWLARVSNELQGEELYAMMRKMQQIDADAASLDRKLADLDGVYTLEREELSVSKEKGEKRRTHFLELIALPAVIFIAAREITYTGGNVYSESAAHELEHVMRFMGLQNQFYSLVSLSLILCLFVWSYLYGLPGGLRGGLKWGSAVWKWVIITTLIVASVSMAYRQPPFRQTTQKEEATKFTPPVVPAAGEPAQRLVPRVQGS